MFSFAFSALRKSRTAKPKRDPLSPLNYPFEDPMPKVALGIIKIGHEAGAVRIWITELVRQGVPIENESVEGTKTLSQRWPSYLYEPLENQYRKECELSLDKSPVELKGTFNSDFGRIGTTIIPSPQRQIVLEFLPPA